MTALGHRVSLLFPRDAQSESLLQASNGGVDIFPFTMPQMVIKPGRKGGRDHLFDKWKLVSGMIRDKGLVTNSPDLVFFPYLDTFLGPYVKVAEIDKLLPYLWTGLYINPQNCRDKWPFSQVRKGILSPNHLLKSKNCRAIGAFDSLASKILQEETGKPVVTLPDMADGIEPNTNFWLAGSIREKARGRKVISLVGAQDRRKGLLTLMKTMDCLDAERYFFVCAGKYNRSVFSAEEIRLIESTVVRHKDNLVFYTERIPGEADFNALILLSDILFAAYLNFSASSNLIGKAALFRKPIIVSKGFYMQELTEKFRLGVAIEQDNPGKLAEAIRQLSTETYLTEYKLENQANAYVEEISEKAFLTGLEEILSEFK